MADPDETLVEEVARVLHDAYEAAAPAHGWATQERSRKPWEDVPEANKATMRSAVNAALAHLAARSLLVGQCDVREEWSPSDDQVGQWALPKLRRTVRTWTTPDGSAGTLEGPWVEVEGQ